MKSLIDYPRDQWKKYRVYYTDGIWDYAVYEAPNKTYARLFARGELNPWHKITRIEEITDGAESA